jgi:histidinol-phosphatase (PHP family)
MVITNYHMHNTYCDGQSETEEYILQAIEKGLISIGFSSHAPVCFESYFNMKKEKLADYLKEIDFFKEKYEEKIQIYTGLEMDYLFQSDVDAVNSLQDKIHYKIASVHYLWDEERKNFYSTDGSFEEVQKTFQKLGKGDPKLFVKKYYEEIVRVVSTQNFEILGHLDIIKKQNKDHCFFNESEKWYEELIEEVLEVVKERGVFVEINTGGILRGYIEDTYPSQWIIQKCFQKNIPILLSSDAHRSDELIGCLEDTRILLKNIGFTYQKAFIKGRWIDLPL